MAPSDDTIVRLRLTELQATLRARAHGREDEWCSVLVDENDEVLWTERTQMVARRRLNALFDADPRAVDRVRLLLLRNGVEELCDWPRRGTPQERAVALLRWANGDRGSPRDALALTIRAHFLRSHEASVQVGRVRHDAFKLYWLSAEGHVPVGMLVRLMDGYWVLLSDRRTPQFADGEVYQRLAEAVRASCGLDADASAIAAVHEGAPHQLPAAAHLVALVAVNVARRLGALEGPWDKVELSGEADA